MQNPNGFAVDVRWVVKGTVHSGTFAAPPGGSFFTTPAVAGTNLVALEWFEQYGTVQRKEKPASAQACTGRTGSTMRTEADLLFPNPARDKAVLRLTHPAGTLVDLVLTDQGSGRVVWKKARVSYPAGGISIAVDQLPAGLYILTVTAGGQPQPIRLYKE